MIVFVLLKGTVRTPKIKKIFIKRHEIFFHFLHRNELFTENVKKGVRDNESNGRMVQPKQLILISIEAEFCALQTYRQFFFSNLILVFRVIHFFPEKCIFVYKT